MRRSDIWLGTVIGQLQECAAPRAAARGGSAPRSSAISSPRCFGKAGGRATRRPTPANPSGATIHNDLRAKGAGRAGRGSAVRRTRARPVPAKRAGYRRDRISGAASAGTVRSGPPRPERLERETLQLARHLAGGGHRRLDVLFLDRVRLVPAKLRHAEQHGDLVVHPVLQHDPETCAPVATARIGSDGAPPRGGSPGARPGT